MAIQPAETREEFDEEPSKEVISEATIEVTKEQPDEYTGVEAQRDTEFTGLSKSTQESLGLSDLGSLEDEISGIDNFDENEFNSSLASYENFILLPKRELSQFLRMVDPLTKASVDQYGKSVQIKSLNKDIVEISYANAPFKLKMRLNNKSGKTVKPFCVVVSLLKRIITESYASLAIIESDGEYSIAVCDSLLFVETVNLDAAEFEIERKEVTEVLDKELGLYNFRKIGPVLSFSDRTSEKIAIVKDGYCYYNTGVFSARVRSPFKTHEPILLFKTAIDALGILMELSKVEVKYTLTPELLIVEADGLIYCEMPVTYKIDDHFSPSVARSLQFKADILIVNDSMARLFSLVKSLEYLSDIVTVSFDDDALTVTLTSKDMKRKSPYKFIIVEGTVETNGDMKVSADVMKPYLDVTGTDVRYAFNEMGLCMTNEMGSFIVRRTN